MLAWLLKIISLALLALNLCAFIVIVSMQRRIAQLESGIIEVAKNQSEIAGSLQQLTDYVWTDMCIDASRIEMFELVQTRLEKLDEQTTIIEETKKLCGRCTHGY